MKRKAIFMIVLLIMIRSSLFSVGNLDKFELGSAIYKDLDKDVTLITGHHWHSALFDFFEYRAGDNKGYLWFTEINQITICCDQRLFAIWLKKINWLNF